MPVDAWGRPYLLDASTGVLVIFGENGVPGGDDDNVDIVVRYKADLKFACAAFTGGGRRVHVGDRLELRFRKPF